MQKHPGYDAAVAYLDLGLDQVRIHFPGLRPTQLSQMRIGKVPLLVILGVGQVVVIAIPMADQVNDLHLAHTIPNTNLPSKPVMAHGKQHVKLCATGCENADLIRQSMAALVSSG